jgi:SAM-dependent methyltransferase
MGWGKTPNRLRALRPPDPFVHDPDELRVDAPLGRWNLYVGGAGARPQGYVNLDLFGVPGVDVVGDVERLPFRDAVFTRVECDAVLEHVVNPEMAVSEIRRVLEAGGYVHMVTPFCHPFHEYPRDFRRFTIDGLVQLGRGFEVVKTGWRTGPTATLLIVILEYAKTVLPWGPLPAIVHGVLGWVLFPFRYVDVLLRRSARAHRIGNHCYIWLRKP